MRFLGKYHHTIDDKNRAFIPAKFRTRLGDNFVVCKRPDYECLLVFPNEEFDEFIESYEKPTPFTETDEMDRQVEFFSNAAEVGLDKQGRIVIPQELCDHAKLKRDIVIVGMRTHLQIWDSEIIQEK